MDQTQWLTERFEENRSHLRRVAYRMLGSLNEADDAVQETWLRLSRSDTSGIENLGGWLTTVIARVCLDMLRSRKARGEEGLGVHLADPVVSRAEGTDPEHEAVQMGASPEVQGASAVAKTFFGRAQAAQRAIVDGTPGLVWAHDGRTRVVFEFTIAQGKIVEIELSADSERIRALDLEVLGP